MSTRLRKVERFNTDVVDGEEGFNAVLQWKPNAIVLDLSFTRNGWLVHLGCYSSHICSHRKGDETRPRNLLGNAIKFTPEHGRIEVSLENDDSEIRLRIHDSGKGMDPELLPHIFEPFVQGDSTSTRRYAGLGLGLTIVHHLVKLHGEPSKPKAPEKKKARSSPCTSRSATCRRSLLKHTSRLVMLVA